MSGLYSWVIPIISYLWHYCKRAAFSAAKQCSKIVQLSRAHLRLGLKLCLHVDITSAFIYTVNPYMALQAHFTMLAQASHWQKQWQ